MSGQSENPINGMFRNLVDGYLKVIDREIRFAFHPVVSDSTEGVTGFEALVRGDGAISADPLSSRISPSDRFAFDQACRVLAIRAARRFEIDGNLHLNCTDVTSHNAELVCMVTRTMAERHGIDRSRVVLEFSNLGAMGSLEELQAICQVFRAYQFQILHDNFGRDGGDPERLEHFRPDWIKFDRSLIENIQDQEAHQARLREYLELCRGLHIQPMAAGIERAEELEWLRTQGVVHFQGYYFTPPELEPQEVYRPGQTLDQD